MDTCHEDKCKDIRLIHTVCCLADSVRIGETFYHLDTWLTSEFFTCANHLRFDHEVSSFQMVYMTSKELVFRGGMQPNNACYQLAHCRPATPEEISQTKKADADRRKEMDPTSRQRELVLSIFDDFIRAAQGERYVDITLHYDGVGTTITLNEFKSNSPLAENKGPVVREMTKHVIGSPAELFGFNTGAALSDLGNGYWGYRPTQTYHYYDMDDMDIEPPIVDDPGDMYDDEVGPSHFDFDFDPPDDEPPDDESIEDTYLAEFNPDNHGDLPRRGQQDVIPCYADSIRPSDTFRYNETWLTCVSVGKPYLVQYYLTRSDPDGTVTTVPVDTRWFENLHCRPATPEEIRQAEEAAEKAAADRRREAQAYYQRRQISLDTHRKVREAATHCLERENKSLRLSSAGKEYWLDKHMSSYGLGSYIQLEGDILFHIQRNSSFDDDWSHNNRYGGIVRRVPDPDPALIEAVRKLPADISSHLEKEYCDKTENRLDNPEEIRYRYHW